MLSGLRTDAAVRSLTDPVNNLQHARLPCIKPGHWAVQSGECHEDHLHLPNAGVGPTQLDHVWLTNVQTVFRSRMPSTLTHRLLHPVRHKKATKRTRQSTTGDLYMVEGCRNNDWNTHCPAPSMPFVPLAALMFLLGDVFVGRGQQDNPTSVPFLTPHAGGGLSPPPLLVVHDRSAFDRACKAMWGREVRAIVLLLPSRPAPDADEDLVPEVFSLDKAPHVAVTSLREGEAVERGTVVVYQPLRSKAVWGAEYTTALDAIKSICGCNVHWGPHGVYWPKAIFSPGLTASNAASLGRVAMRPNSSRAPQILLGASGGEGHVV